MPKVAAKSNQSPVREATDERLGTGLRERFRAVDGRMRRTVDLKDGSTVRTYLGEGGREVQPGVTSSDVADRAWLQWKVAPEPIGEEEFGVVDLFCGVGGMSHGVAEAARAAGRSARFVGVDSDDVAVNAYQRSVPLGRGLSADVSRVFDGRRGSRVTASERAFRRLAGETEILLGGPPCQGHSAFNNRTRHADDRNALYLSMVRAAEVLEPRHVVVENVPGALRDRTSVVQRSMDALEKLGYALSYGIVDMVQIGVPQLRRRLIVIASRSTVPSIDELVDSHRTCVRSVRWAIEDLETMGADRPVDTPARSAPQTRARIGVLFDRGLRDLPNEYRPKCHAGGNHSYGSIYGRLSWDEPAQTITTGFYSMCMGRYVHPSQRRTLTAHEAARLQFLPDYLNLDAIEQRGDLARLIGNAVPLKLGYAVGLELLR
jgi:DNA (cytosine-5)-methyltransferase 1